MIDVSRVRAVDPGGVAATVSSSPTARARKIGRALGIAVFAAVVGGSTVAWTIQILRQVWGAPARVTAGTCRPAIVALIRAVYRARESSAHASATETALVSSFRAALRPEWDERSAIGIRCANDREAMRALAEVDRFRYAEEHGVRYLSVDLGRRRANVSRIERAFSRSESERTVDTASRPAR